MPLSDEIWSVLCMTVAHINHLTIHLTQLESPCKIAEARFDFAVDSGCSSRVFRATIRRALRSRKWAFL